MTNKTILITGGAGFIGSNLCEKFLQQNNHVRCLDNLATGLYSNIQPFLSNPLFTWIEGDVRDLNTCLEAAQGADMICHQAALGSVPRSVAEPLRSHDSNVTGFLNILEAAKAAKIKRVVYASSSSVYGDSPELPKQEDKIGRPISPYAVTKLTDELYAHAYGLLYPLELIGLRYFNVFGKRQRPDGPYAAVVPKFIALMLKGEAPEIHGTGSQSRDFTYIANVLQANELALSTTNPAALNTVYNVACGSRTTVLELFEGLRNVLCVYKPELSDMKPFFAPSRAGDVPHSLASISKISTLLGYQPTHTFEQGLADAIVWYKDNHG
ncbi:MAG: SDR family oxidoreductase [Cytophagales bacterium]|nr:MAG: SDR family oxidoreductase [Cytophagales bacterium]TAF61277.1 MAG: SDR family oxidoreductase [Cytophagales bacterium]